MSTLNTQGNDQTNSDFDRDFDRDLRRYLRREKRAYKDFLIQNPEQTHALRRLDLWLNRTRKIGHWLLENGYQIPPEFLEPYDISIADRRSSRLSLKYQLRGLNTLRELSRFHIFLPELVAPGAGKLKILDPSSGGCGTAEVAKYFGHDIENRDFFSTEQDIFGNAYEKIHGALGLDVAHFDGSARPFPFADKSYDYILCNQAVDAYGPPDQWEMAIDDFARIARIGVQVIFNPVLKRYNPDGIDHIENCIVSLKKKYTLREAECVETNKRGVVIQLG